MRLFRQPRELIVIRNPLNPTVSDVEQYIGHDLESLIKQAFPQGLTESVKFYHGSLLKEVPRDTEQDIDNLLRLEGRIYAVIKPMGVETIIAIAVSVLVSVAVALLMPIPTVNQNASTTQAPSPNNALAQRTNRQRLGGRVPDIYGELWATPDLLSQPYTFYFNHKQTEFAYMCLGRGRFNVVKAFDDATPIEQIKGSSVYVYDPNESYWDNSPKFRFGEEATAEELTYMNLYAKRYSSVNGQSVNPADDLIGGDIRFGAKNLVRAEGFDFTTVFKAGDILSVSGADDLASYNGIVVNGRVARYNMNGDYTIAKVTPDYLELSSPESVNAYWADLNKNNDSTVATRLTISSPNNNGWLGWFYTSSTDHEDVFVNLKAPNGIYQQLQDSWYPVGLQFEIESELVDSQYNPIAGTTEFKTIFMRSPNAEKHIKNNVWVRSTDDRVRETAAMSIFIFNSHFGRGKRLRWRIRRATPRLYDKKSTYLQDVKIVDFYGASGITRDLVPKGVTTVLSKTIATEGALSVKERKLRLLVQRYVKDWRNGDNLILSKRADDILYDIATDSKLGNLATSQINMSQISAEVDRVVANFGTALASEFCYTFDDNNVSAEEMLQTVAKAVFSQAYRFNNQINLLFERKLSASVAIFNSHNILPDTFEKSESFGVHNDNDGVSVEYIDPVDDAQMTINTSEGLSNAKKETLIGVRNKIQAHLHMMRIWNKLQYSYKSCEFTGGDESGIVVRSNRITVADQSRADIQQGEVVDIVMNGSDIVLQTSNPVELTTQNNTLFIQTVNNGVEAIPCFANDSYSVKLARLPSGVISLGYGNVVTATYQIVKDNDKERDSYLVTEKTPSDGLTNKLTCINYTDKYYQNDSDYRNNQIPTTPTN